MKERDFQKSLIKELKEKFPGCMVLKQDPNYKQGIPDLLILHKDRWAALECKRSKDAKEKDKEHPNQGHYVDMMNDMSYASYIYPENKQEVLDDLQQTFGPRRSTRSVRSK